MKQYKFAKSVFDKDAILKTVYLWQDILVSEDEFNYIIEVNSLNNFDIDKFKMVNDTYGHQCGDEVIRYVASLLNRGALKHGGIAGRYGGEEFVVAFFEKDLDETYHIVEDIHNQIRSEEVVYEGKHISVRASVGVASYPQTCANPGELLTRADWAMYHSKKNGRDRITIDSEKISSQM